MWIVYFCSADVETRRCSDSSEFQESSGTGGIPASQIAATTTISVPPVNHHRESYFPSNGIDSNSDPVLEVFEEPVDEPVSIKIFCVNSLPSYF